MEGLAEISLDQFQSSEPKRTLIIGKILLALKRAVKALKEYYNHLHSDGNIDLSLKFPYIISFELLDNEHEVQFKYKEKLDEGKYVYVVETIEKERKGKEKQKEIPELLIVKFVTRYELDLHKFCAKKEIAPMIYGYKEINCDWKMVIMDYLSDFRPLTIPPSKPDAIKKKILKAVSYIHNEGLVHGDLREYNILYKEKEQKDGNSNIIVKIVDFDWGGKASEVRYPPRLNPTIPWHSDVAIDKPIEKAHDEHLLQLTIRNYLNV